MPYLTETFDGGTGLRRVGEGVLTGREIIETIRALPEAVPTLDRITHALVDLTGVTRLEVSNAELDTIASIDRAYAARFRIMRVAIAAPSDLAFGIARMYEAALSRVGWEVQVFRELQAAEAWMKESPGD